MNTIKKREVKILNRMLKELTQKLADVNQDDSEQVRNRNVKFLREYHLTVLLEIAGDIISPYEENPEALIKKFFYDFRSIRQAEKVPDQFPTLQHFFYWWTHSDTINKERQSTK